MYKGLKWRDKASTTLELSKYKCTILGLWMDLGELMTSLIMALKERL